MRWLLLVLLVAPQDTKHPHLFFKGRPPEFPWKNRLDDLKQTPPGLALHWRYTGDEASAKACVAALKKMDADEGYGLYATGPVLYLPLCYDWLSDWKGFKERAEIEQRIVKTADACRAFLDGKDDSVWHTSAPRAAMGVGLAGLALGGKKGAEYLAFTKTYLEKTYFPAMESLDGAAVAGMSYGVTESFFPLCVLLWAMRGEVDYFPKQKWLQKRLEYLVDSIQPDHTFVRWGDVVGGGRCSTRDEVRPVLDMLAAAYDSKDGFAMSARIAKKWSSAGYHAEVLWLAPFFARAGDDATIRRPLASIYGRDSVGHAFLRSGWGDDDTVVFFKCGDYFDDHGHFDQGSFTIHRRGPLAIDDFAYGGFDADHRMKYGRLAVAHNTLLIGGGQRVVKSQDSQDLADHAQKKKARALETGDVVAWQVEKDYVYVSADLTAAYDPKIVKLATRELVWLGGGTLVVFDKVEATEPARWLLHAIEPPKVNGAVFMIESRDATLVGQTILPAKPALMTVEGWTVDGKDFPPGEKGEFHVVGGHRIEVSGGAAFLHVLTALDKGREAPRAKRVDGECGVEVGGRKVTFKASGVARSVVVK